MEGRSIFAVAKLGDSGEETASSEKELRKVNTVLDSDGIKIMH